ncbi:hypothetical protein BD779DRAFT_268683 [Infundibulicybe gibba]|nr:hypothetical protein BD779DRAFT_268683 [Infundibulicybe gibba]
MSTESSSDSKPGLIPLNLHPPTPLGDQQSVEFPCIGSPDQSIVHDPQTPSNASPASNTTSSSKLTSSDKLTALRESTQGSPAPNWNTRSPNHLPGIARGFRRSLDASVSLPSFVTGTGEIESPVLNHTGTQQIICSQSSFDWYSFPCEFTRPLSWQGDPEATGIVRK